MGYPIWPEVPVFYQDCRSDIERIKHRIRRAAEKSDDRAELDSWKFAALAWEKLEPVITNILKWKEVMIDACVVNHQSWYEGDPKRTLNELIAYEVAIALDPAVSAEARKLQSDAIAKAAGEVVAGMERTMRCGDCLMLVGEQHRPGCHRQGLVTETSDYRDRHNWKFGDPLVVCMRCGAVRTQANDSAVCQ